MTTLCSALQGAPSLCASSAAHSQDQIQKIELESQERQGPPLRDGAGLCIAGRSTMPRLGKQQMRCMVELSRSAVVRLYQENVLHLGT